MRIFSTLLLAFFLLSFITLQAEDTNSTTYRSIDNNTFTDTFLNVSTLQSTPDPEITNCLTVINDSNIIADPFFLAAGFLRLYSNGTKEYNLYLDVIDQANNIYSFEAIVSLLSSQSQVYVLQSITQLTINSSVNKNTTSRPTLLRSPITQNTGQSPSNLDQLYSTLTAGFTQLTSAQIAADSAVAKIQSDIQNSYPAVKNSELSAVFTKAQGLSTAYMVFLSRRQSEKVKLWSGYAVVDSLKKTFYIISLSQVDTTSLTK